MSHETSPELSTLASRVMLEAKGGGPIRTHRVQLLAAMHEALAKPKHYTHAMSDDERKLDALELVLRPYIDAAESLAGSVLSQDETPGGR